MYEPGWQRQVPACRWSLISQEKPSASPSALPLPPGIKSPSLEYLVINGILSFNYLFYLEFQISNIEFEISAAATIA